MSSYHHFRTILKDILTISHKENGFYIEIKDSEKSRIPEHWKGMYEAGPFDTEKEAKKEILIWEVIEQLKWDFSLNDYEAVFELLNNISAKSLKAYLPDKPELINDDIYDGDCDEDAGTFETKWGYRKGW